MSDDAYVEEREFTLRVEVRCRFPSDYDGEADGQAWWPAIEPALAEIVRGAVAILARQPGCRVRAGNRGRPAADEVTLIVEREAGPGSGSE
jgi:hypothetical protein